MQHSDGLQRLGLLDGTSVLELFILLEAHPRVLATVENDVGKESEETN